MTVADFVDWSHHSEKKIKNRKKNIDKKTIKKKFHQNKIWGKLFKFFFILKKDGRI